MRALAIVMALAAPASADMFPKVQGAGLLHYELEALHAIDTTERAEGDAPRAKEIILAGARLHGMIGQGSTVNYYLGLDLAAGGTLRGGGFAYDVALLPIGVGVRFGRTSFVGIGAGIGASGATGVMDDALTFPLDAIGEFGGGKLRLLARARVSAIANSAPRENGAPSLPFGDELEAMLALRVGNHWEQYDFPTGNGYFAGVAYREIAGVRFIGLTIGHSIDAAMPRKNVDEEEERRARKRRTRRRQRDDSFYE